MRAERRALAVELQRRADQRHGAVGPLLQHADCRELRMRHHLLEIEHRRARHANAAELVDPGRDRVACDRGGDQRIQFVAVGDAVRIGLETGVRRPFRMAERVGEPLEQVVVAGRDHHPAVARLIRLVGTDAEILRSHAARHAAAREIVRRMLVGPSKRRLVERGADLAALPGGRAPVQRRQDSDHRPHGAALVDDRRPRAHGLAAVLAGEAHQAAEGLHQRIVAGPVLERAVGTVGREIAIDQRRAWRRARSRRRDRSSRAGPAAGSAPPRRPRRE